MAKTYEPEDLIKRIFMLVTAGISIQIAVIVVVIFL